MGQTKGLTGEAAAKRKSARKDFLYMRRNIKKDLYGPLKKPWVKKMARGEELADDIGGDRSKGKLTRGTTNLI